MFCFGKNIQFWGFSVLQFKYERAVVFNSDLKFEYLPNQIRTHYVVKKQSDDAIAIKCRRP